MSVGLPERFDLRDEGHALRIEWTWPRLMGLPLLVFSVFWDGFLVFWYSDAAGRPPHSEIEWMFLLFPLGHVAVGLIIPYVAVAFLVNRTVVDVGGGEIRVTHGPLPFPGNKRMPVTDLRQLFCVERAGRKGGVTYDVMARLMSDREVKLLSGLLSDREARFLEEQIEQRLGLADVPVDGEWPHQPAR